MDLREIHREQRLLQVDLAYSALVALTLMLREEGLGVCRWLTFKQNAFGILEPLLLDPLKELDLLTSDLGFVGRYPD